MKKIILTTASALMFISCATNHMKEETTFNYPETKKGKVEYTHFGTTIKDPYRWLEDDQAADTKAWVKAQNKVTYNYLDQIPFRAKIKQQMTELWNYEKISAPFKRGGWHYFYKNDGLQQHAVLYRKKNEKTAPEVFLDPNQFSADGTTSLSGITFSESGKLAAYQISEGGSDWRKVIIIDAESKKQIGDTLRDVKFSGIAWKGDQGFYYSSYDKPTGSELSAKTNQHKLYFHQLGTAQKEDQLIFGGEKMPRRYVGAQVTEDQGFLVISAAQSTNGNELYIQDLKQENSPLITILNHFDTNTSIIDNQGDTLYLLTDYNAPNNRLVKVDFKNPQPENWVDVIPEKKEVLHITTAGSFFFAHYLKDAQSKIEQYNHQGKKIRDIQLPAMGSASGFSAKKDEQDTYFSFTNYITPSSIYHFDVISGEIALYQKPAINFNPADYVSEQVFYTSKDGTKIPMTINYKKGTKMNGKNPTLLYGYGGFNISLTPAYSVTKAVWLENGGIYAVANLRGGGEYGKEWHDAGTKMQKKNVFNDFIAAAEYLQANAYTSPAYTAIDGRSNGGLLVAATETMRPDLFRVALPGVGVLDMLRYHTFTAGAGWAYDYGTAEDSKEMFEYLKSYSPVHNVKKDICYPSTLVLTGDHDDRVVPAHSYKFVSELQDKQQQTQNCHHPTLIRIETKAGHGAGKPTALIIEEYTDAMSFALYEMGIKKLEEE